MITKAIYKNFKCLRDVELDFVDGVNIISGSSDKGKTTALKGILWATTNMPQGKQSITHGEKGNHVIVEIDGHKITRGIDERNFYSLDKERFTAFRLAIPPPIEELVKISDINIQNRRDLPFMISEKSGDAAERFSTMLDLQEIGISLSNVDTEVTAISQKKKQIEEQISNISAKLQELEWIDKASDELTLLEKKESHLLELEDKLSKSRLLYDKFRMEYAVYAKYKPAIEALSELGGMDRLCIDLDKMTMEHSNYGRLTRMHIELSDKIAAQSSVIDAKNELNNLVALHERIASDENTARQLGKLLSAYTSNYMEMGKLKEALPADRELSDILDKAEQCRDMTSKLSTMSNIARQYQEAVNIVQQSQRAHNELETAFKAMFPDICPLCDSVIKK